MRENFGRAVLPEPALTPPRLSRSVKSWLSAEDVSLEESRSLESFRLLLMDDFRLIASRVLALPAEACPDDLAAVVIVPKRGDSGFLEQDKILYTLLDMTPMGGDVVFHYIDRLLPGAPASNPRTAAAHFYFAPRKSLYVAANRIARFDLLTLKKLSFVEQARFLEPEDRMKTNSTGANNRYEVTLVLPHDRTGEFPYWEFKSFGINLGFEVYDRNRVLLLDVARVIISGPRTRLPLLAEFSLVREIIESASSRTFHKNCPVW